MKMVEGIFNKAVNIYLEQVIDRKRKRFDNKLWDCYNVQRKKFFSIIKENRKTEVGKSIGLDKVYTIEDFKNRKKICEYEDFSGYVEEEKIGIKNSLVSKPVKYFALTAGTTSYPKFIPQVSSYIRLRRRAWEFWLSFMLKKNGLELYKGAMLNVVGTPYEGETNGGIKYGNVSGFLYFIQESVFKYVYAIPEEVYRIEEFDMKYYLVLLFSVREDLEILLAPNPSSLVLMGKKLDIWKKELLEDLQNNSIKSLENNDEVPEDLRKCILSRFRKERKKNLRSGKFLESLINSKDRIYPKEVFKNLKVISCWKGGSLGGYLRKLPGYYGDVNVSEIGYMASEGRFTIPVEGCDEDEGVLDIESGFYEFIELADYERYGKNSGTYLASEVEKGKKYYFIVTNENGLYRYFMNDIVEVVGFKGTTPVIRFVQKGKYFSSVTGEKISEWEVVESMKRATRSLDFGYVTFFCKVVHSEIPFYRFYVEFSSCVSSEFKEQVALLLDKELRSLNVEYNEKRNSGRLENVEVVELKPGALDKLRKGFAKGRQDTQVKVPKLIAIEKDVEILKNLGLV